MPDRRFSARPDLADIPPHCWKALTFAAHAVTVNAGRVLVVDDEANLRSMLDAVLTHNGFSVTLASNGARALEALAVEPADVVVLDVMMPEVDGFETCRRMRARGDRTPVLFLTARDSTADTVRGLDLGGDDYLHKPFMPTELVARVKALIRRVEPDDRCRLRCGDLVLDEAAHTVERAGRPIDLSRREFDLLRVLLQNQGHVLTKADLLRDVWNDNDVTEAALESSISYVRRKIDAEGPPLIRTIRGVGYTVRSS